MGTGLGILLVKDYVRKNGGALLIESKLGIGSQFSFSLPNTNNELS
jgi:signal transduction histidine kinase